MSGGVDSSLATARAVEAGHDVVGVYLALHENRASSDVLDPNATQVGCGNPKDAADAEAISNQLGIEFQQWDYAEVFSKIVIEDFLAQYAAGFTPNPCVRCNETVKFALLLNHGMEHGFDAVLTGHYARTMPHAGSEFTDLTELHRAAYRGKDQSYVLAAIGQEALNHVMFPLGEYESKEAVRAEAAARGLSVSSKPDSYDICFIPDRNTQGFLRARLGEQPGLIKDHTGKVLGEHRGAYAYTIGQRKGLGLKDHTVDGNPRYVVDVDVKSNVVTIGPKDLLSISGIRATKAVWLAPDISANDWIDTTVQVRSAGRPLRAKVRGDGDDIHVDLQEELRGLARGQSVVVYDDTRVLGQGVIAETTR